MIWDPYKNKLNILVNKYNDRKELKEYILDRISGKSSDPSIDYGHDEQPEQFLIWAYNETKDECFKSNFNEASKDILSEQLEKINPECQDNKDLLSRILYVATKCNITQVLKPLKDKIIKNDVLDDFVRKNLLGVDVTYSTNLLKQSLFAIITLQQRGDSELRKFWMPILESNKPPGFRYLALQGLEKFMGLDAMKHFHYYLEDLADCYQQSDNKDNVVLETARTLNFFFKSKSPDGETLFNRPELLLNNIYIVSNSLETFWVVAKLVEDSLSYLLERNDVFVDDEMKGKWEKVMLSIRDERGIIECVAEKLWKSYIWDYGFKATFSIYFKQKFINPYFKEGGKPHFAEKDVKVYSIQSQRSWEELINGTEGIRKKLVA